MENISRMFELLLFSRVQTIVVYSNKKSHFGGSGEALGRLREAPGRLPGGSREAPGRLCEALGGSARVQTALGKLREAPGRLWEAILGASWGARRPCVGRLGDILEAYEAIPGRPGAPE